MGNPEFAFRNIGLIFLLVLMFQTSAQAQEICIIPASLKIAENNVVGAIVANFSIAGGVTLSVEPPANTTFDIINDNQLIATSVLDRETTGNYQVTITCRREAPLTETTHFVIVIVDDVNDNAPVFAQNQYSLDVDEWLPVGTSVGAYPATDKDLNTRLYYSLSSNPEGFAMQAATSPNIVVQTLFDYDTVKSVTLTLYARDTATPSPPDEPSYTGTTTILVTIKDVDNRPPWFQPCTNSSVGGAIVCQASGYTGMVNLTEMKVGPLPLEPGPLYAIDGDSGINDEITYRFLSGNDAGVFEINPNSGNITMLKPAEVAGPNELTVLAAQKSNPNQFATTTVTITAVIKSDNPPRFEKTQYNALVTGVGTMALDPSQDNQPLRIQANDDDFPGGLNPGITYKILGSSDFSLLGGYLFMTKDLPLGPVSLQVVAVDPSNGESATTELTVEVTKGITTTTMAPSTTDMVSTLESTTTIEMTSGTPALTSQPALPSTDPSTSTAESPTTANTAGPPTEGGGGKSGDYGPEDMAALGASLAVLLVVCMAVIGFLVHRIQRGKADWGKISEAAIFRSSLGRGSGGLKEGVQYTNDGFQNDEDSDSMGSGRTGQVDVSLGSEPRTRAGDIPLEETILKSTAPLHALLTDNTSLAGSDKADSEKEVKPILTKERRVEEGYKSVWFKEDIDPNAKEEVVIIPDNRDRDGDDEEEEEEEGSSSGREEDEEDNLPKSRPKVLFADTDMDSGLGVRIQDSALDSEDDQMQTADL